MAKNVGVPFKLLKEFMDRRVTVETSSGEIFKGLVRDVEDNLSVSLDDVKTTFIDGTVGRMEGVYIRGCRVRLICLPDSAADCIADLTRPPNRGRGGFRGGRGRGGGKFSRGERSNRR